MNSRTPPLWLPRPISAPSGALLIAVWIWAIWSCAEHWRGNPNYSYGWAVPLLALGFAVRRSLLSSGGDFANEGVFGNSQMARPGGAVPWQQHRVLQIVIAVLAGAGVFMLEYAREQVWHPEIVLWAICLLAVVSTLAVLRIFGGRALARSELFPVLFFLTAVPWPPRFEQPIVSGLMRWVAETTTELLHWFGIEAQTSGAAIALNSGLVGITEACSGVRSLQAGVMFGLAMGEWFLLRPARRVILVLVAVGLALATNLARTVALCLEAEWHGLDSIERVHDTIGNVVITALIIGIWIAGRMLAQTGANGSPLSTGHIIPRIRLFVSHILARAMPAGTALMLAFAVGIISARSLSVWQETREGTQTVPKFSVRAGGANQFKPIPRGIWNELRPTSAEAVRHENAGLPGGSGNCFHFFWKPSPWNRFVLVHRPDICMPGVGWILDGPAEPIEVTLNGRSIRFYLFRFHRGTVSALELWGVWRNGDPVPLEYQAAQVLGAAVPPPSLNLEGKRHSATEIVSCSLITDGILPSSEIAVALLQSVFEYKEHE